MQQSVDDLLARMVTAWDAGDAAAYARLFTTDATYVTFTGAVCSGREDIRRSHEPVLTRWRRGSRMRVRVRSTRALGDDVLVVVSDGGIGTGRRVRLDKVQTLVLERQADGSWLCSAFQNSRRNRLLNRIAEHGVDRTGSADAGPVGAAAGQHGQQHGDDDQDGAGGPGRRA